MEVSGAGKSPNSTISFRYNANNEELEELFNPCEDDPPTPQCDPISSTQGENASPKRGDRTPSIIDKYFKSMRSEKSVEKEKVEDVKVAESKTEKEETRSSSTPKEITASPMKEYLNRFGKRSTAEVTETKESTNETWKFIHDFKFKIAQAVEDMKTKPAEETKEKTVARDNSTSDSEENSVVKDVDQQSVGDTDNQVSSLDSSIQNLSEVTQPITAKAAEKDLSLSMDNKHSESSDDTHKNLAHSDITEDYLNDGLLDVESGVEALEDTMEEFGGVTCIPIIGHSEKPLNTTPSKPPPTPNNFGIPPSQTNLRKKDNETKPKIQLLNFTVYFLTCLLIANYLLFPESSSWNGFLFGIWFVYLAGNVKDWVLDNFFSDREPIGIQLKRSSAMPATYTIPSVKEHRPMKKYEAWINHYRFPDYDPLSYHINKTTTAFMKLEGCNLRISYTRTKIAKRALWDEKIEKISFYQHRLYNLTGARVILLPDGLVKRRLWSKKYPICVILNDKEKIQVLEKESSPTEKRPSDADKLKKEPLSPETESTETNTSPEKKKKFVWRRREKSVHSEGEPGREGLRHRLVRKMHRADNKKTDTVSTSTEPVCEPQGQNSEKPSEDSPDDQLVTKATNSKEEVDEDLDDTEISKIKEFLEETEQETGTDGQLEGEWSIHVKDSRDRNSRLYLFTRTGRDKYEWYRRLLTAISEASSADSSSAEDKSAPVNTKDGIDVSVYKADNDTVSFAKNINKASDSISEGVTISLSQGLAADSDSYEKIFWPYLLKIIQSKTSSLTCECRMLPSEVTWLNTALARVMFDVMRDPQLIARVQSRIQKKLHTLKLPSFMSPLTVTDLSLTGACPLIERVLPPTWDASGVWLDADLRYDGGAYIALLTQINLMKLKEKNMTLEEQLFVTSEHIVESDLSGSPVSERQFRKRKPAVYDSELEDSAESSSDDESPPVQPVDSDPNISVSDSVASATPGEGGSSKKKFLRMVDRIATSKYFQQVTDYKYVKRAMEGLSNTDIKLHLEIHGLEGRLAFNLPPPPHDRLWIGFRTNPQLVLKARPAVGARTLRFAHITNWIEQKLSKEFEKVLVLPNMEDIIIDVMTPTPVKYD